MRSTSSSTRKRSFASGLWPSSNSFSARSLGRLGSTASFWHVMAVPAVAGGAGRLFLETAREQFKDQPREEVRFRHEPAAYNHPLLPNAPTKVWASLIIASCLP
jgi:hypothetical protein